MPFFKKNRKTQQEKDEKLAQSIDEQRMKNQEKFSEREEEAYKKDKKYSLPDSSVRSEEGHQQTENVQTIGKDQIAKATEILKKYKDGKANLDSRIIENEQWWKMRHWELAGEDKKDKVKPASAWLFNSIANKHADAMDNYPEPSVLPRAMDDEQTAKQLSSILPVIIEQNDYEQVYSDTWWYKLKQGTGIKGIFWNEEKNNGLGDIEIKRCDILNLFWEPGITDIQDSKNLFHLALVDNEVLNEEYPDLEAKSNISGLDVKKYIYDDTVDTSNKSIVVDWYYKKTNEDGKKIVHYVKYVGDKILYASENEDRWRERGYYDHGDFPFVFDTLFVEEGTPCGFGYIDIMKECQMYIDKMNANILENALVCSKKRYFVRDDGGINIDDYMDFSKSVVRVNGNIDENSIREIDNTPLASVYLEVLNSKIEELKETSGNRDFSQGSTSSGVTAASAISALMEAGSKLTRDMLKSSYRAFVKECYLIIELMKQFYTEPRCFRITGESGKKEFETFDNSYLIPQKQGTEFGEDMGYREPVFDITVSAAKKATYSRMAQNELAKEFYNLGFFNPQQTDQTLACLEMMDFDGKEKIIEKVKENGTMLDKINVLQQQMLQMGAIIDNLQGSDITGNMQQQFATGAIGEVPLQQISEPAQTQAEKSADRVRESTSVGGEKE